MSLLLPFRFARSGSRRARRAVGRSALFGLVLVLLLAGQGCSNDDPTGGVLANPCLDFDPDGAAVAGAVTTRLSDDSTCTLVTVEIVATGINDVWSLDTTLTYDPSVVAWTGNSTVDSVLGADGTAVAALVDLTGTGELTIGISRVAADDGVDIGAEGGVLLELFFALNTTVAGDGVITLGDECLRTVGEPPPVIPGVTCSGGTFTVQ